MGTVGDLSKSLPSPYSLHTRYSLIVFPCFSFAFPPAPLFSRVTSARTEKCYRQLAFPREVNFFSTFRLPSHKSRSLQLPTSPWVLLWAHVHDTVRCERRYLKNRVIGEENSNPSAPTSEIFFPFAFFLNTTVEFSWSFRLLALLVLVSSCSDA